MRWISSASEVKVVAPPLSTEGVLPFMPFHLRTLRPDELRCCQMGGREAPMLGTTASLRLLTAGSHKKSAIA